MSYNPQERPHMLDNGTFKTRSASRLLCRPSLARCDCVQCWNDPRYLLVVWQVLFTTHCAVLYCFALDDPYHWLYARCGIGFWLWNNDQRFMHSEPLRLLVSFCFTFVHTFGFGISISFWLCRCFWSLLLASSLRHLLPPVEEHAAFNALTAKSVSVPRMGT